MELTEIRIKLMESSEDRLRAFCSITIDGSFVVRDLKIIDGANGPFVAMPSRKLTGHCNRCHHKNHLRANYCNHCGNKLSFDQEGPFDSPQKLYADVAHPINSECREMIQNAVVKEFEAELKRCQQPGYRSRYDDEFADVDDDVDEDIETAYVDSAHIKPDAPRSRESPSGDRETSEQRSSDQPQDRDQGDGDDEFGAGIF